MSDRWIGAKSPTDGNTTSTLLQVLELLKNPQEDLDIVHIGGTNGKGSILSYLESVLVESGYTVGAFTSPYLVDVTESIRINRQDIDRADFLNLEKYIVSTADENDLYLSPFEVLVAMAFVYFKREDVDLVLLEVGLGGRDDGTNVSTRAKAVVFGPISLDHTGILGDTTEEITQIKSGIIKSESPVFSYPQSPKVKEILDRVSREHSTSVDYLDREDVAEISVEKTGSIFKYKGEEYSISVPGLHQVYNSALAIEVLEYLKTDYKNIEKGLHSGLKKATISYRTEYLDEYFLIDGAHNVDSLNSLVEYLKGIEYDRLILGFSILEDKDIEPFLEKLIPMADEIVLTEINRDRYLPLKELTEQVESSTQVPVYSYKSIKKGVDKTVEIREKEDLILWCGSFYLIKDVKEYYNS